MARKKLIQLRAIAENGVVRLTCYRSTRYFRRKHGRDRFRTLRIWRQHIAGFQFNFDYAEYFDGLHVNDATLILEQPVEPESDRKFTVVDTDVALGEVYAYWAAAATGEPTGPFSVAVRDPDVWWPEESLNICIADLQKRYPERVTVEKIGQTVRGRDLQAIHIGRGQKGLALIGALHAGESGPELMLPALEALLLEDAGALEKVSVHAVPVVNLDERQRQVEGVPWYLRANANGVDLNRNFPAGWETVEYDYGMDSSDEESMSYRGPRPASEPETRAVMAFLRDLRPDAVYAFHALAGICGPKFLVASAAEADEDYLSRCWGLARAYAAGMGSESDPDNAFKLACPSGSLPAWCHSELRIPAFDMEMLRDDEGYDKCVAGRTDQPLLQVYRRRHLGGMRRAMEHLAE